MHLTRGRQKMKLKLNERFFRPLIIHTTVCWLKIPVWFEWSDDNDSEHGKCIDILFCILFSTFDSINGVTAEANSFSYQNCWLKEGHFIITILIIILLLAFCKFVCIYRMRVCNCVCFLGFVLERRKKSNTTSQKRQCDVVKSRGI